MMSSVAGYPPSFWRLFTLTTLVPVNENLSGLLSNVHTTCAWIMIVLIAIHILGALKHALIDRDDTLKRMWF